MNVRLEVTGDGVAVVSLVSPDPLHRLDNAMRDELIAILSAVEDHPDVRALLLRADGPNFSAGADLRQFGLAPDIFEARWIRWRRDPWLALWEARVPTVAALHGIALGSGFEMALLCDVRLCAPGARIGLPEARLGMLPGACGTQSLPRLIGIDAAVPIVLRGEVMDAERALAVGLVHELAADVDAAALGAAQRLAALPRSCAEAATAALRASAEHSLGAGLAIERRLSRRVVAAGIAGRPD